MLEYVLRWHNLIKWNIYIQPKPEDIHQLPYEWVVLWDVLCCGMSDSNAKKRYKLISSKKRRSTYNDIISHKQCF